MTNDQIPHAPDSERAVIGALLLNPAIISPTRERLEPRHFYLESNREPYAALCALAERGIAVDPIQLAEELRARGTLDKVGGLAHVANFINGALPSQIDGHVERVLESTARRKLWRAAMQAAEAANSGASAAEIAAVMRAAAEETAQVSAPKAEKVVAQALSRIISAQQVLATDYPEPVFAVHGLLPQGVSFLAGPPKLGKSTLALGLAVAVAEGGKALSSLDVERGSVLYLALEDSERRIQDRLQRLTHGKISDRLQICTTWPRLNEGGLEAIDLWIEQHSDARLLIVDTLKMLRPLRRGRNSSIYDEDYDAVQPLTTIAAQRLALMLVHHTRKALADDPLATVSGSYGLTGAADGVLVLSRSRNRSDGTLSVIGRDLEEKELALRFDGKLSQWSVIGEASEVRRSSERQEVIDFLGGVGRLAAPTEIARALGRKAATVRKLLLGMLSAGEVKSFAAGEYQLPNYAPPLPPPPQESVTAALPALPLTFSTGNAHRSRKSRQVNHLQNSVTSVTGVTGFSSNAVENAGERYREKPVTPVTLVTLNANILQTEEFAEQVALPVENVNGNAGNAAVTLKPRRVTL